jgi:hypothetical protein
LLSVSSTNEPCPEKILLLNAYEQKAAQYSQAALELKDKVRNIPQIELNVLWAAAEQARIACEKARELLQQHAAAHGCGPRQP